MIRAIYLFILISLFSLAGVWLANNPGGVSVRWGGYVIETSMIFLAVATVIAALVVSLLVLIYRWIRKSPGRIGGAFFARRRTKGLEALSNGMVAIAAGDAEEARKAAVQAEKHLKGEPLALLLSAQAAELNDDKRAAKIYYDRMTERQDTEFLGLRGLIAQARADNDLEGALRHTRRAEELKPRTEWVQKALVELLIEKKDYDAAASVVMRMMRSKKSQQNEALRHLKAVISHEQALGAFERGEQDAALRYANEAHRQEPAFVPASTFLVRHMAPGRGRDKLLEAAWAAGPHPDLAAVAKALVLAEDPRDWFKRAKSFMLKSNPDHLETHLALARAALEAREYGEAREHLVAAEKINPTVSVYRLLAELEETANADAAAARNWILKSTEAAPDPTWMCTSCGSQSATWSSHCPTCNSFDSLKWREMQKHVEAPDLIEAEVVEELPATMNKA